MPREAQRASELSIARRGHADAGPEVAVENGHSADRPHCGHTHRASRQGWQHCLVGKPLSLVLARELVAGGLSENLADLGRCRLAARPLDHHMDLSPDENRGGKHPVAGRLLGRRRLAGQGLLVDHGQAFDHLPIDRHNFAGMHDDDIALLQSLGRHLDLHAILAQPGESRLLAERVQQHPLGVVPRHPYQEPPKAQAPAHHSTRENRQRSQAADHDHGVESIHAHAPFLAKDPPRRLKRWNRRIGDDDGRNG